MLAQIPGQIILTQIVEIRSGVELPSRREDVEFHTIDGLTLVGELALPIDSEPTATLITFHPLPTHGGFMDSHLFRKAANRLPALANLAVLRFNTRGTVSPRGKSGGEFGEGISEKADLDAAIRFATSRNLPNLWLVGWSFGTELVLKYGRDEPILGVILLSPPLHRTSEVELEAWDNNGKRVIAVIPEFDDYLRPEEAATRFSVIRQAELIAISGAKHLWVGESATKSVLNEIVRATNPARFPLPETFAV